MGRTISILQWPLTSCKITTLSLDVLWSFICYRQSTVYDNTKRDFEFYRVPWGFPKEYHGVPQSYISNLRCPIIPLFVVIKKVPKPKRQICPEASLWSRNEIHQMPSLWIDFTLLVKLLPSGNTDSSTKTEIDSWILPLTSPPNLTDGVPREVYRRTVGLPV